MSLNYPKVLSREDVLEITALARTFLESSKELAKLSQRNHPNLDQAIWMIDLAIKTAEGALSKLRSKV